MARILVVDDSQDQRALLKFLLEKTPEWQVDFAHDGLEAAEHLNNADVHLIISDLQMPRMDGLELLAHVCEHYPLVPVVIMTAVGSEELAVSALQQGAAGYLPKHTLRSTLVNVVESVLSAAGETRSSQEVAERMTGWRQELELENERRLTGPVVAYFQRQLDAFDLCTSGERIQMGVALEEALVNAIIHGNLEVTSDLRGENDEAYYDLIESRKQSAPWNARRVHVTAEFDRDQAVFTIRDQGRGFNPATLPDPTDPEQLIKASGRGLLLIRSFMDDVTHSEDGTEIRMVKRRSTERSDVPSPKESRARHEFLTTG